MVDLLYWVIKCLNDYLAFRVEEEKNIGFVVFKVVVWFFILLFCFISKV